MKLYKYMSTNAGKGFFSVPSLRLTPAFCLNDPFELSIPSSMLNNMSQNGYDAGNVNNFMKDHGVVSLTESYSNLLMWSHYAGDHSGVVVEFDFESKSPLSLFNSHEPPPSSDVNFGHVNYNKKRSCLNWLKYRTLKKVMKPYYFTKSNDWKYEKEYRFVLPFVMANRILIDTKNSESDAVFELLNIEKPKNLDGLYEHFLDVTIATNMDGLANIWSNSKDNGVMFFIPINEKNIRRVFLGVNSNHNEFDSALKDFCWGRYHCNINKEFNSILKASVHDDAFKLVFNPHQSTLHER